jgi:dihydrofolate synthase/folylpolyglutamate synthase
MFGSHQIDNLSLAIATYQTLIPVTSNFADSLHNLNIWPARLQRIKNTNLYIDGSHNEAGAKTILEFLRSKKDSKRIVIYSTLQDKNYNNFLSLIADEIDELIITAIPNEPKSETPINIQKVANTLHIKNKIMDHISINEVMITAQENTTTLVTGSLYSAGYHLDQIFQKSHNNQ